MTVVALDLDGLKRINDAHGHDRGDQMIRTCAAACASGVREMDFVARLGGDEFSILLPDCHEQAALHVVGRILESLPDGYSFSAGVARWNGEETEAALTQRADLALYAGKRAGGARIAVAGDPS